MRTNSGFGSRMSLSEVTRRRHVRGGDHQSDTMFSDVSLEERIPQDHPLRPMGGWSMRRCTRCPPASPGATAGRAGRRSIAPEKLLRAQLLQILYTIRSERLLMEQLDYNRLFRWFVGLHLGDDPVWDMTVFIKNRDRANGNLARGTRSPCRRRCAPGSVLAPVQRVSPAVPGSSGTGAPLWPADPVVNAATAGPDRDSSV